VAQSLIVRPARHPLDARRPPCGLTRAATRLRLVFLCVLGLNLDGLAVDSGRAAVDLGLAPVHLGHRRVRRALGLLDRVALVRSRPVCPPAGALLTPARFGR
jgi:hypothetical protein